MYLASQHRQCTSSSLEAVYPHNVLNFPTKMYKIPTEINNIWQSEISPHDRIDKNQVDPVAGVQNGRKAPKKCIESASPTTKPSKSLCVTVFSIFSIKSILVFIWWPSFVFMEQQYCNRIANLVSKLHNCSYKASNWTMNKMITIQSMFRNTQG